MIKELVNIQVASSQVIGRTDLDVVSGAVDIMTSDPVSWVTINGGADVCFCTKK